MREISEALGLLAFMAKAEVRHARLKIYLPVPAM
jgi:hypothetical protein